MTRGPADSLDTVDSAPTGETVPNEALLGALAKAGVEIDAFIADVAAADLQRLRRDPNLPAVRCVEDLFPETSLLKMVLHCLRARELESIVCVNRGFKENCYNARLLTGRACMALTGQDCEPNAAEARKWYRICADMHGTREALCMLGGMANEGGASNKLTELISSLGEAAVDLDESERCLRAAIAADDSHPATYVILAPADNALDAARVDLAMTLADKACRGGYGPDASRLLAEAGVLLDAVLDHAEVPSVHEVPFRCPWREAATMKAQMIKRGEVAGTPHDILALIEAIAPDDRDGCCEHWLADSYKTLDEENPNEEHARRAFEHMSRAYKARHPSSPFGMGELAERGRGTEARLDRAYYMYLVAAFHCHDERAVARLTEVYAAGPPYPPELIEALGGFNHLEMASEITVEEAFVALGITATSSDDDSDSDGQ